MTRNNILLLTTVGALIPPTIIVDRAREHFEKAQPATSK
jgi:hypothetical protein